MRLIPTIAIALVISVAIPAGLLLIGELTPAYRAEPVKEGGVPESAIPSPMEPIREQPPIRANPESKPDLVAKPPNQEGQIGPPEPKVIPPPKQPDPEQRAAQLPKQPSQIPQQIPQPQQRVVIEVKPPGYSTGSALLTLQRTIGDEGKEYVRANLIDADLIPFRVKGLHGDVNRVISLKQAFEEIDARTTYCQTMWDQGRVPSGCHEKPVMYLELTEDQTRALVNLINPLLDGMWYRERILPNGDVDRSWGSVVVFNEVRYRLLIDSTWRR